MVATSENWKKWERQIDTARLKIIHPPSKESSCQGVKQDVVFVDETGGQNGALMSRRRIVAVTALEEFIEGSEDEEVRDEIRSEVFERSRNY